jgi:hypothetical protein
VNQKNFRNKHCNEIWKYSSLQHNLQDINSLQSQPKEKLTYLIPKLINSQITLGNKYEMEVTRNITLNGRGNKPLMEGYNKQLDKK